MIEIKDYNGKEFASAKEIHALLGIKKHFTDWIKYSVERVYMIQSVDYEHYHKFVELPNKAKRKTLDDYLLTKQSAIIIAVMSGGENAKQVREEVIKAFEQRQSGILLDSKEVFALTDMVKAMTLVSSQDKAENMHYEFHNYKYDWYKYRADILGYSAHSLKKAMKQANKKYKSQKQALIHLDKSEIIRTGIIDLLIALGRTEEYALNVAEFAKNITKQNGYDTQIWNDKKPNPLGINDNVINERKLLFQNTINN